MIVRVRCRNVFFFLHNLSLEVNRSPGLFPLTLFIFPFLASRRGPMMVAKLEKPENQRQSVNARIFQHLH